MFFIIIYFKAKLGENNFGHDLNNIHGTLPFFLCLCLKHSSFMLRRFLMKQSTEGMSTCFMFTQVLKKGSIFLGKVPVQGYNVFGTVAQSKMQATQISFPIKPSTIKIHTVSFHLSYSQLRALFYPLKYYE